MHFANGEKLAHSQIMIKIPSGNQTWKRTIPENFPLGTSMRFPIAMFGCADDMSYSMPCWKIIHLCSMMFPQSPFTLGI